MKQVGVTDQNGNKHPGFVGWTTFNALINGMIIDQFFKGPTPTHTVLTSEDPQGQYCYTIKNVNLTFSSEVEVTLLEWRDPPERCRKMWEGIRAVALTHEQTHVASVEQALVEANRRWSEREFDACAATPAEAEALAVAAFTRQVQIEEAQVISDVKRASDLLHSTENSVAVPCTCEPARAFVGHWPDPYGDHHPMAIAAVSCSGDFNGWWIVASSAQPGVTFSVDSLVGTINNDGAYLSRVRLGETAEVAYAPPFDAVLSAVDEETIDPKIRIVISNPYTGGDVLFEQTYALAELESDEKPYMCVLP